MIVERKIKKAFQTDPSVETEREQDGAMQFRYTGSISLIYI